jgi:outer membrane protein
MKKRILFFTAFIVSIFCIESLSAQNGFPQKAAYINSKNIFDSIPQRAKAAAAIAELNKKYKEELQIMQNDYNRKYSDYMMYEGSMTENIKLRRMQELYELEDRISKFMKTAQEDIETQERIQIEPLRQKMNDAIYQVGIEQGFVCIYDLANPSIVFVTPEAVNATPLVKEKLGIK